MVAQGEPRGEPAWVRFAIRGIILVGVLIQSRSLNIFFHQDDFDVLARLASDPSPLSSAVARHNDHFPVTMNVFYLLFLRAFGATALPWHVLLLVLLAANGALVDALLRRLECGPPARIFAVGTFTASAVFHETVYWVACSNFTLALFFSLAALVCLARAEEHGPRAWRTAALACSLLAMLSASIAVVLPVLAFAVAWAMPAPRPARRIASFAAIPAAGVLFVSLTALLAGSEAAASIGGSAVARFDARGGIILAARGTVERLAAGYFTGGRLPGGVAMALLLVLVGAACLRARGRDAPPRAASVAAPLIWIFASGFAVYAFRSWLGEVVFVSRYQLFPAVGFAWLAALAVDGAIQAAGRIGPRWRSRATVVVLGGLLPAALAMSAYAHKVVAERWLDRTQALERAHEDVARGLRALAAEARRDGRTIVIRDYFVGGGTGSRPRLGAMSAYLLSKDERRSLRFIDERTTPLPSSLLPAAAGLAEGKRSWLEWLDDLSVSDAALGDPIAGQPIALRTLFPHLERGVAEDHGRLTLLRPLGQGQVAVLRTGPRDDIARWRALSLDVRAAAAGELLVAFTGPLVPELGRGARIHLHPGEGRRVLIDVPLATRGAAASVREVEIRLVGDLTTYEIGEVVVGTASVPPGQ